MHTHSGPHASLPRYHVQIRRWKAGTSRQQVRCHQTQVGTGLASMQAARFWVGVGVGSGCNVGELRYTFWWWRRTSIEILSNCRWVCLAVWQWNCIRRRDDIRSPGKINSTHLNRKRTPQYYSSGRELSVMCKPKKSEWRKKKSFSLAYVSNNSDPDLHRTQNLALKTFSKMPTQPTARARTHTHLEASTRNNIH